MQSKYLDCFSKQSDLLVFKMKHIARYLTMLTVILGLMLIITMPVTASSTDAIFAISGKTTVLPVIPDANGAKTVSGNNYGPLNIPPYLVGTKSNGNPKYDLITFDNPFAVRSDVVQLPIILYGTEYMITLQKEHHSFLPAGKDFYSGTIPELPNSEVVLFVFEPNVITGTICLENDCIEIAVAQNKEYGHQTSHPVHVVYSYNDLPKNVKPAVADYLESEFLKQYHDYSKDPDTGLSIRSNQDWVTVNILLATDSAYNARVYDWSQEGYRLIRALETSYAYRDLRVNLVVSFDYSKMTALSSHWAKVMDPHFVAKYVFPDSYLDSKNADIVVYLGGYDQYNPNMPTGQQSIVGMAGFPWERERVAWIQMVPDIEPTISTFTATDHARSYVFIHELGHIFGAEHEIYQEVINGPYSVMVPAYDMYGVGKTSLNYSPAGADEISYWRTRVSGYF